MVLTFALCATFVFAQTMTPRTKESKAPATMKTAVSQNTTSSSIFTKDQVLLTVDFHDGTKTGNTWTGTGYTTGTVTGQGGHAETYNYSFWQRWTTSTTDQAAMLEMYSAMNSGFFGSRMAEYMFSVYLLDTTNATENNGFMMISLYDQRTPYSGNFNAYIAFDTVNASNAGIVDLQFYQNYARYYDKTYMDYSTNNGATWTPVEINVTGVDLAVNERLRGVVTYSLPLAAAHQSSLKVRLRAYSEDANRGAYGYWWIVDDVNIIAGPADRLSYYGQEFVEGNYSIIPQGMSINPAWYSQVKNSGSNNQSGLSVSLASSTVAADDLQPFASMSVPTINAGESTQIYCDNGGFLFVDSLEYRGWYGYCTTYASQANQGSTALPTANTGDYLLAASISNGAISHNYDTMFYTVRGAESSLNGGYRWGHDNGLLCYTGNAINAWVYGYIQQGSNWYVTDDPEEVDFYAPGYRATTRYTTDAVVPEGWVIRGVEMVASPSNGYYSTGAQISPVLLQDEYDGGSVQFNTVNTGAGVYTVTAQDVNDSTIIGRADGMGVKNIGEYNTIFIPFPEQPALTPHTSYRIGYLVESEAYLAMAQEAHGSYREMSPTRPDQYDTVYFFQNIPTMKQYSHYMTPNVYQSYVYDPANGGTFAYYADYSPMIRMIVGPEMAVTRYNVEINCVGEEYGMTYYGGEEACGETVTPAEHSTATIMFQPAEQCVLVSLKIDGQTIEAYDENTDEGDENFVYYEEDNIYAYTLNDITANHTIEVTYAEGAPEAIDPVASSVRMNLQPNPATSQVSLNIEGVEGMVNCSIIDMSGRVVYTADMNAENAQVINLNNLAKGAYFVRVTNNNFTKVEKLIVR